MVCSPPVRPRIPDRIKAEFGDMSLEVLAKFGDMQIGCMISFSGRMDEKRLARAARLSLDAEPVLGCRMVRRFFRPFWRRCEKLDDIRICPVKETEDIEGETIRFQLIPFDPVNGPRVRFLLLRGKTDRLCVAVDHHAADAGGVKEYAYLLASIYRKLTAEPDYRPAPNLTGSRSYTQVWNRFGFKDKLRIFLGGLRMGWRLFYPWAFWKFPAKGESPAYFIRRVGPERFRGIKDYCDRAGVTVNDVVVAAVYRTFHELIKPPPDLPLRCLTTADLRRYLPSGRAEGICNLSGLVHLNIGRRLGTGFDETLRIVAGHMNALKRNFIGLSDYATLPNLAKLFPFKWIVALFQGFFGLAFKVGNVPTGITNMGRIDPALLDFGEPEVSDAFLAVPPVNPPGLILGLSGFRKSMTFTLGTRRPPPGDSDMYHFLDRLVENLPGGPPSS